MGPSLTSLPFEINNLIYRECLVDAINGVEPQGRLICNRTLKKQLHPNILRVSKLVYAQASAVLYEHNLLRFEPPYACVVRGSAALLYKESFPRGNFGRIKHLELFFQPKGAQYICDDNEEIMAVLDYVHNLRCSLRTLRLAFAFREFAEDDPANRNRSIYAEWNQMSPASKLCASTKLRNYVFALEVENKTEIIFMSDSEEDFMHFESFANQIGSQKQWAVIPERRAFINKNDGVSVKEEEKNSEDKDPGESIHSTQDPSKAGLYEPEVNDGGSYESSSEGSSDEGYLPQSADFDGGFSDGYAESDEEVYAARYSWIWTLVPATVATKDKIPRVDDC